MVKVLLYLILLLPIVSSGQEKFSRKLTLMGCRFEITVIASNQQEGDKYIDIAAKEVSRIEHLISEWDSTTQISEVNRNAGIKPVKVDKEVFDLIVRSIKISELTDGAFDITSRNSDGAFELIAVDIFASNGERGPIVEVQARYFALVPLRLPD